MIIEFELSPKSKNEAQLIIPFCKHILHNMRKDISNQIDIERYTPFEDKLLNASWIIWVEKPKTINIVQLLRFTLLNLRCAKRGESRYVIGFKNTMLPNTRTRIDALVRFLDKGNEISQPTYVFTKIFNRYRDNLDQYWRDYVFVQTQRFPRSHIEV